MVVITDYKNFGAAIAEVGQALRQGGAPGRVVGGLAYEPKSANQLRGEWSGKLDKSMFIRTARAIAGDLASALPAAIAGHPAVRPGPEPRRPASVRRRLRPGPGHGYGLEPSGIRPSQPRARRHVPAADPAPGPRVRARHRLRAGAADRRTAAAASIFRPCPAQSASAAGPASAAAGRAATPARLAVGAAAAGPRLCRPACLPASAGRAGKRRAIRPPWTQPPDASARSALVCPAG